MSLTIVNLVFPSVLTEKVVDQAVCEKTLSSEEVQILRNAIDKSYMFEIYVRDLPITKPVGLRILEEGSIAKYYLVTNLHFFLGYNDGEVVSARVTSDENLVDIDSLDPRTVTFRYSVDWEPSDTPVHARLHQ